MLLLMENTGDDDEHFKDAVNRCWSGRRRYLDKKKLL